MDSQKITEIDTLILEEKKSIAREHFIDVWESANAEGIDPDLMAKALVEGALSELASMQGDEAAAKLVNQIRSMESNGEFLADKTIQ
ncbi:MAG: hypothetical protein AB8B49_10940 [Nitratireductor sp.]